MVVVNYFQSKEKAEAVAADIGKQALAVYGDVRVKADMEALACGIPLGFLIPPSCRFRASARRAGNPMPRRLPNSIASQARIPPKQ